MPILTTERLELRELVPEDAPFILELMNDPDWIRFIGDRRVRSVEDARDYLSNHYIPSYARFGFGLWAAELPGEPAPIGICGLVKRTWLNDVDLGFGFLPAWRGRGLAREAAEACIAYASGSLGLARLLAVVSPGNDASTGLLTRLGFGFAGMFHREEAPEVCLYSRPLP